MPNALKTLDQTNTLSIQSDKTVNLQMNLERDIILEIIKKHITYKDLKEDEQANNFSP